jgi:hypothetical protein
MLPCLTAGTSVITRLRALSPSIAVLCHGRVVSIRAGLSSPNSPERCSAGREGAFGGPRAWC